MYITPTHKKGPQDIDSFNICELSFISIKECMFAIMKLHRMCSLCFRGELHVGISPNTPQLGRL